MTDRIWLVAVCFALVLGYALGYWQGRPDAPMVSEAAPAPAAVEADPEGQDEDAQRAVGSIALRLPTPLDPNRATAEELSALPGIGPVLAGRIVEARQQRPFESVDELRRVKGVGGKLLERLRPYLAVE